MRTLRLTFGLVSFAALGLAQKPSISTVVNAGSNLLPVLPNGGIAQGALMILYGSGMGPGTLTGFGQYPVPATLAGTSVHISTSTASFDSPVYYTSSTQVAAIMPSTVPQGTATVTLTYNGAASNGFAVSVVQNNIGLYTVNSAGSGNAVVTFTDYSYVTPSNAAHPGDYVILWATGLGPIPGSDAGQPAADNQSNVPLEAYIGGKSAAILYQGRNSCCAALDQINIQVPAGVAGCVTPLVLKIGNLVSNATTIPLALSGSACSTNDPATTTAAYQALLTAPNPAFAQVAILQSTIFQPGVLGGFNSSTASAGSAFFTKYSAPPLATLNSLMELPPPGSCALTLNTGAAGPATTALDAGSQITISGPNGVTPYAAASPGSGSYLGNFNGSTLPTGQYVVSGAGGKDIGAFSATISFPPPVTWTNQASMATVTRSNGVTVTWTTAATTGLMQISGQSSVPMTSTTNATVRFDCVASVTDGTFTVPAAVLLALPATTAALGTLTVGNTYSRAPFTAPGINHGLIYYGTTNLNLSLVTYK